jgi:hypothetical protein
MVIADCLEEFPGAGFGRELSRTVQDKVQAKELLFWGLW